MSDSSAASSTQLALTCCAPRTIEAITQDCSSSGGRYSESTGVRPLPRFKLSSAVCSCSWVRSGEMRKCLSSVVSSPAGSRSISVNKCSGSTLKCVCLAHSSAARSSAARMSPSRRRMRVRSSVLMTCAFKSKARRHGCAAFAGITGFAHPGIPAQSRRGLCRQAAGR